MSNHNIININLIIKQCLGGSGILMNTFKDKIHDPDSCKDVWDDFYNKVYKNEFEKYFDFNDIEDKETNFKCKRLYIKLRKDMDYGQKFPKFKMAGDCIFNFNSKKVEIFKKYIDRSCEGENLLNECSNRHHKFANFAFMPITGGMNSVKGIILSKLDRPDIYINELKKYFNKEQNRIFSCARGNNGPLEWYLSLFNNNIYEYFDKVYLIDDKEFIDNEFLKFANNKIKDAFSAIKFMKMAVTFWNIREANINKYLDSN